MAELIKPGVDRLAVAEGGHSYHYTFPVTTSDPEVIARLKRQGAIEAPRHRPPSYFKQPREEVKKDDAPTS